MCSLAGHGFVFPIVRIAKALVRAGHAVAIVTGPEYADVIAAEGLERIARGDRDGPSFEVKNWGHLLSVAIQVKHLEYALRSFQPDAIVTTHLTFGPLIVAERLGIPVCVLGGARYLFPANAGAIARGPQTEPELNLQWMYDEQVRIYNDVIRVPYGLPPVSSDVAAPAVLGDGLLLRTAPALVPSGDDLPANVHPIGACLWEPAGDDDELTRWLTETDGRPLAYVQLGRSFDRASSWPMVRATFARLGIRAVVSCARFDIDIDAAEFTADFFIRPHVMQGQVLPRCDLVVASGHPTAPLGAVSAGTRLMLLPNSSCTDAFAAMCVGKNYALSLDGNTVTADQLTAALERLMSDRGLAANMAAAQRSLNALDSDREAVGAVERIASGRRRMAETS